MSTKICPRCKEEKPLAEFHVNRITKSGRQVYCKTCKTKFQKDNQENLNRYHQKYRASKKYKEWYQVWRLKNRKKILANGVARNASIRLAALSHYGLKCACCGEATLVFLAIDHVNGGGTRQRKETGRSSSGFYYWLRKNGYPKGFQTLCHNCNWAKHMLGKCPHCLAERRLPNLQGALSI